ncbi:DUF418 domain-containing protein [Pontibacter locisalis]|uniref:DUF418 domain-containing protein n=1 Tax=Pontibacter locisalis TaxID=1719035 RepID=A0ABW5IS23_9BACT
MLIWDGDILIRYSLVGLFILTIIPLRKNLILFSAVFVYILHSIYALQLNAPPILPVQADAPITHSTYLQLVIFRSKEIFVSYSTIDSFFYSVKVLSFMLFGLYCSSLLTLPRQNKFNWPTMLMLLVSIRMATAILSFVLQGSEADIIISFLNYLLTPSIYVTALLTLTTIEALKGVIFFFSSVGRMSLTNYLLQNLVMTFIFYSYGLDQYQKWQPWQLLAFAVLLFLVQGYISSLWLQYQNQGPVEKLWRYFTYERQAKRKAQLK